MVTLAYSPDILNFDKLPVLSSTWLKCYFLNFFIFWYSLICSCFNCLSIVPSLCNPVLLVEFGAAWEADNSKEVVFTARNRTGTLNKFGIKKGVEYSGNNGHFDKLALDILKFEKLSLLSSTWLSTYFLKFFIFWYSLICRHFDCLTILRASGASSSYASLVAFHCLSTMWGVGRTRVTKKWSKTKNTLPLPALVTQELTCHCLEQIIKLHMSQAHWASLNPICCKYANCLITHDNYNII